MFILKLAGKILLLPVWLILFVIGLAVKMTVQTYAVVRGILGFIFTLLIIATAYCYHDWVQVAFLFSLSVILYLILFAGVFVDTVPCHLYLHQRSGSFQRADLLMSQSGISTFRYDNQPKHFFHKIFHMSSLLLIQEPDKS